MRVIALFLFLLHVFSARAIDVVMVNPSLEGNPFWDRVSGAFLAAADDLSFNGRIIYGNDDRLSYYQAIESLLAEPKQPDYILLSPYSGNALATFKLLESHKLPFITLERTLPDEEQLQLGAPGIKFTYWLGEIFHDNVDAGKLLANTLIDLAYKNDKSDLIKLVGLSGSHSGESSFRSKGLVASVNENLNPNIDLLQIVPAYWSSTKAEQTYEHLVNRYGNIDIVWAASDGMAIGALKASKRHQRERALIAGGIDWTQQAIASIEKGELNASVGGHFFQGAFALVKLYDHIHGISDTFSEGNGSRAYKLALITQKNLAQYAFLKNKINWDLFNFKHLTKVHDPKNNYSFSIDEVITLITQ